MAICLLIWPKIHNTKIIMQVSQQGVNLLSSVLHTSWDSLIINHQHYPTLFNISAVVQSRDRCLRASYLYSPLYIIIFDKFNALLSIPENYEIFKIYTGANIIFKSKIYMLLLLLLLFDDNKLEMVRKSGKKEKQNPVWFIGEGKR